MLSAPAGAQAQDTAAFLLGFVGNVGDDAKSGSLSLKQPVNDPVFFLFVCFCFVFCTRCFIIFFTGNQGKSTLQFIQVFNCCGSFYVC